MSRRGKRSDVPSNSAAWATVSSRSFSGNVVHPLPVRAVALISGRRIQRAGRSGELVASPGELPLGQDERAVRRKVGHEPGGYGLFALVGGAVGAQSAEGDGVGAALGREVAAESEHVRPGRKPQAFQARELAEAEAFGDEAAGVVADGKVGEPVGDGDAAVEGAGAFGGLGGVLGDVGGDLAVGQVPGGGDRAGVEFTPPGQRPGREARSSRDLQVDGAGGLVDGGGEQGKGRPGGRGRGRPGGAIEPDDGVEVDDAAPLVFGDLGVGDPDLGGERLVGEPGLAGESAAQRDGEAAPQFRSAGVEQDGAGVVVAVWA